MTTSTLVKTIMFAASQETVWAFLTEKDKLAIWFHRSDSDLADGSNFSMFGEDADNPVCWGNVLEMDRPNLLKYSFTIKPMGGHTTTVTWLLEQFQSGTKLTLTHEGFEAVGDNALGFVSAIDAGWDRHFGKLRDAAAT